jgi:very-short-patch-repair endonuclease
MNKRKYYYNPSLKSLARANRKQMSPAEVRLWTEVLRAGKMYGHTFNRQRPVLQYIVDFMCKSLWLIIEVDGRSHHEAGQWRLDRERQGELEEKGFTVLRFSDNQIMTELENVIMGIEDTVLALERNLE